MRRGLPANAIVSKPGAKDRRFRSVRWMQVQQRAVHRKLWRMRCYPRENFIHINGTVKRRRRLYAH